MFLQYSGFKFFCLLVFNSNLNIISRKLYAVCLEIPQLIKSGQICNGALDCLDRSDESGCQVQTPVPFEDIFVNCIIVEGDNNYKNIGDNGTFGFQCGKGICLDWDIWCNRDREMGEKEDPYLSMICPTLLAQIQNPQLCSNQTFWKTRNCNNGILRCKGNLPGQCRHPKNELVRDDECESPDFMSSTTCFDKSDYPSNFPCSFTELTEHCRNQVNCVHKDLWCDGHFNCPDGSDEDPEVCLKCPREFGYPAGKSQFATISCLHRYTNKSICAVPCDGVDDLCEGFIDEQCELSSIKFTISFLLILLVLTGVVAEIVFHMETKYDKNQSEPLMNCNFLLEFLTTICTKEDHQDSATTKHNLDKFSQFHDDQMSRKDVEELVLNIQHMGDKEFQLSMASTFYQMELIHHCKNDQETLICLKHHLGTNETSAWFLDILLPRSCAQQVYAEIKNKIKKLFKKSLNKKKSSGSSKNKRFKVKSVLKNVGLTLFLVMFYYLDLIKDCYLFFILYQKVSFLRPFHSFEIQLLLLTSVSILLPQIANCLYMIKSAFSRKVDIISAILLSLVTFVAPAVGLHTMCRLKIEKDLVVGKLNHDEAHDYCMTNKLAFYTSSIRRWSRRCSALKMNEITFENTLQVAILLFVVLMKFSSSKTVAGLENIISGEEAEFVALSAIWSIISLVLGEIKWQAASKNFFLPIKGKLILFAYFSISLLSRTVAVLLYFCPSVGLLNILDHWKMGSLKTTPERVQYDLFENQTVAYFEDKWVVISHYKELTQWDLETYFIAFLICTAIHYTMVLIVKFCFAINFTSKTSLFRKFFHILSHLKCPTIFQDWDEDVGLSLSNVKRNWKQVTREIKALLALFTAEHILMCIPLWILSFNIYKRNIFLDQFFPQVEEEKRATSLAYSLSLVFPLIFLALPLLQYGFFILYHKQGHPWANLLCSKTQLNENENNFEMEELKLIGTWKQTHLTHNEDEMEQKEKIVLTEQKSQIKLTDQLHLIDQLEKIEQKDQVQPMAKKGLKQTNGLNSANVLVEQLVQLNQLGVMDELVQKQQIEQKEKIQQKEQIQQMKQKDCIQQMDGLGPMDKMEQRDQFCQMDHLKQMEQKDQI